MFSNINKSNKGWFKLRKVESAQKQKMESLENGQSTKFFMFSTKKLKYFYFLAWFKLKIVTKS